MESNKTAMANTVPYKVIHKHSIDHTGRPSETLSTARLSHDPPFKIQNKISGLSTLTGNNLTTTIYPSFFKGNQELERFTASSTKDNTHKHFTKTTGSLGRSPGKAQIIPLSKTLHTLQDCKTEFVFDSSDDNATAPRVKTHSIKSLLTSCLKASLFNTDSSELVSIKTQPEPKQVHTIMQHYSHHPFKNLSEKGKQKIWCKCGQDSVLPCCKQAASWIRCVCLRTSQRFDYLNSKNYYQRLVETKLRNNREQIEQIGRDLNRTFPACPFFCIEGLFHMRRVLTAYSNYDPEIGYVQGMNFLVGSLLYHSSEEIAFWLFVSLMEKYRTNEVIVYDSDIHCFCPSLLTCLKINGLQTLFTQKEIFLTGLPGLFAHSQRIKELISSHLPNISSALQNFNISTEMFAPNWVITLFSNVIPIEEMRFFYNEFFEHSWDSFYKVLVHLLRLHEKDVVSAEDTAEAIALIKNPKPREKLSSIPLLDRIIIEVDWKTLIINSRSEKL